MGPTAATEGQQLIKRTKSEEEILKKRPKRKIVGKKDPDMTDKESDVVSINSLPNPESVDKARSPVPSTGAKSNRKVKPPPPPSRRKDVEIPSTNVGAVSKRIDETDSTASTAVDKTLNGGTKSKRNPDVVGSTSSIIAASSNGGAKCRIRTDSTKIVNEEKRSQSLARFASSNKTCSYSNSPINDVVVCSNDLSPKLPVARYCRYLQ